MIYIMAHRAFDAPELPGYAPLQVGAAIHADLGYLRDDAGENISAKNPYYCELTGLYWVWKNRDDAVKGLAHYRRYLAHSRMTGGYAGVIPFDRLARKLEDVDIILPSRMYHRRKTNLEQMSPRYCEERYYRALREIIGQRCPDYMMDLDAFFSDRRGSFANVMVARREQFDAYCAWLFDILFALEERISSEWPEDDPLRLYGYISERLLNVYVRRNGLRVATWPMINLSDNFHQRLLNMRHAALNRLRYLRRKVFHG